MYKLDDDDVQTFFPPLDDEPHSDLWEEKVTLCEELEISMLDHGTREEHAMVEGFRLAGIEKEDAIRRLNIPPEMFDLLYSEIWENLLIAVHSEVVKSTVFFAQHGDHQARRDYFANVYPIIGDEIKGKTAKIIDAVLDDDKPMDVDEIKKEARRLGIPLPIFEEHLNDE